MQLMEGNLTKHVREGVPKDSSALFRWVRCPDASPGTGGIDYDF
jgi:hypothetical protein